MIDKIRIGHYTDLENATGCTVILCPEKNITSCYVPGSAPGSRETELLAPHRKIETIHAILLTGGSAYGLSAATGVMSYLEENETGYITSAGIVPIVPAAVIYDLNIGKNYIRPTAENAYQACVDAREGNTDQGTIGAGTGATVGKWSGLESGMKGGLGQASISQGPVTVSAISVVNSVGDIIDMKGRTIAGAITSDKKFIGLENQTIRWKDSRVGLNENTVISAIITNVKMNKTQTYNMARRAQNGIARAINPANTSYDGDIIFSVSLDEITADMDIIYEVATETLRQSIINAVLHAESLHGYLSSGDLR